MVCREFEEEGLFLLGGREEDVVEGEEGGARTMWMSDSLPVPIQGPVEWRVLRWRWVWRAR